MSTLITGGHGFLGNHLRKLLPGADAPTHDELDLLKDPIPAYDLIYHLAAYCGGIGTNQANPARAFKQNLELGMRVIEQTKGKLVLVGTTCSYPDIPDSYPFVESEFWAGYPQETNSAYGIAKKALWTYAKACGISFIYPVQANLYGPGFKDDHVIPDLIRKFVRAKRENAPQVVLWGDGTPEREFLHVSDCTRALVFLAENASDSWWDGEIVNVGSGETHTIAETAELVAEAVRFEGNIVWDSSKPNGQMRRLLDSSKLRSLAWRPEIDFEKGVRDTVTWYREQYELA